MVVLFKQKTACEMRISDGSSDVCSSDLGHVIEADPPRRLVHSWDESGDTPNEVIFELAEMGDKVLFTLVHRRLSGRAGMLSVGAGWHAHLDILQDRQSGG